MIWEESTLDFMQSSLKSSSAVRAAQAPVWVHAASVGEVKGISPLVFKLLECETKLVITTTSDTGKAEASRLFPSADVNKAPLDISFLVRSFIKEKKPKLLIINETEIWPSMISEAKKFGIPIVLVNGRISDRSYPRYKFFKFYFARVLKKIDYILTQSELDKDRFIFLGARADRVSIAGSTKFDQQATALDEAKYELQKKLLLNENDFVITFGSIREEEEDLILSALKEIFSRKQEINPKIFIVPRHPERFDLFFNKLKDLEINGSKILASKLTDIREVGVINKNTKLILANTLGELLLFYKLADICFVGGTFSKVGGHNIAEPLLFAKPLIIGPEIHSQKEAFNIINSLGALIQVSTSAELATQILYFIDNKKNLQNISKNSDGAMLALRGTTDRVFEVVKGYL